MDKRIVTGDEACYFTITELEDNKELFMSVPAILKTKEDEKS